MHSWLSGSHWRFGALLVVGALGWVACGNEAESPASLSPVSALTDPREEVPLPPVGDPGSLLELYESMLGTYPGATDAGVFEEEVGRWMNNHLSGKVTDDIWDEVVATMLANPDLAPEQRKTLEAMLATLKNGYDGETGSNWSETRDTLRNWFQDHLTDPAFTEREDQRKLDQERIRREVMEDLLGPQPEVEQPKFLSRPPSDLRGRASQQLPEATESEDDESSEDESCGVQDWEACLRSYATTCADHAEDIASTYNQYADVACRLAAGACAAAIVGSPLWPACAAATAACLTARAVARAEYRHALRRCLDGFCGPRPYCI